MRGWQVVERGRAVLSNDLGEPTLDPVDPESTVVAVHAAAVNFADRLMIDGRYQLRPQIPFVPGFEVAGVVTATSSTRIRVGDRVVGTTDPAHGSWAEFARADARHLTLLPDDVGWVDGVALHVNAQTAWFALHRAARVQTSDAVLVHAAAGGVGSMAIQLAAAHGCTVVGTASADKLDVVRSCGAAVAIDRRDPDWAGVMRDAVGEVDVVVDPVGESMFAGSWRSLAFEGRYVSVGYASGGIPTVRANEALVRNVSLHGMYWTPYATRRPDLVAEAARHVFALHRGGRITPHVTVLASLDDALRCLDRIAAGATTGKSVVTVERPGDAS